MVFDPHPTGAAGAEVCSPCTEWRGQLAAIIEAEHLVGFIPGAPAVQSPGIDAEDIGRLQPS